MVVSAVVGVACLVPVVVVVVVVADAVVDDVAVAVADDVAALVVVSCEIAWVSGCSIAIFGVMSKLGLLRVSAEIEEAGLDLVKHDGSVQVPRPSGMRIDQQHLHQGFGYPKTGPPRIDQQHLHTGFGYPKSGLPVPSSTNIYSPSKVSVV